MESLSVDVSGEIIKNLLKHENYEEYISICQTNKHIANICKWLETNNPKFWLELLPPPPFFISDGKKQIIYDKRMTVGEKINPDFGKVTDGVTPEFLKMTTFELWKMVTLYNLIKNGEVDIAIKIMKRYPNHMNTILWFIAPDSLDLPSNDNLLNERLIRFFISKDENNYLNEYRGDVSLEGATVRFVIKDISPDLIEYIANRTDDDYDEYDYDYDDEKENGLLYSYGFNTSYIRKWNIPGDLLVIAANNNNIRMVEYMMDNYGDKLSLDVKQLALIMSDKNNYNHITNLLKNKYNITLTKAQLKKVDRVKRTGCIIPMDGDFDEDD